MKTQESISSTWEDLVFENRNKAYGAFELRKSYSKSLSEAAFASILFAGLLLIGPQLISLMRSANPVLSINPTVDPTVVLQTVPIIDPVKPAGSSIKTSKRDLAPLVTTNLVPDNEVAPPTNNPSSDIEVPGSETLPTQGYTNSGVETVVVLPPPSIVNWAEDMPAYEGGLKAMMKFIQKNLKYPNRAKHLGIEGKVFIKFVVNYEGKVVNVEISKGIFEDCDKEAARVIAMMPDWKPGMQNKTPVSVRMILPINFILEN